MEIGMGNWNISFFYKTLVKQSFNSITILFSSFIYSLLLYKEENVGHILLKDFLLSNTKLKYTFNCQNIIIQVNILKNVICNKNQLTTKQSISSFPISPIPSTCHSDKTLPTPYLQRHPPRKGPSDRTLRIPRVEITRNNKPPRLPLYMARGYIEDRVCSRTYDTPERESERTKYPRFQ